MKRLPDYSQHFLRSPRLVKELIGHSSIKSGDLVYDIGAGSGVISSALASRCREVIAIEFEPRTAAKLRENMKRFPNVKVVEKDFIKMDISDVSYKVFANIPFHLSSPIVRKLVEADRQPQAAYLIVQKQFAGKLQINNDTFTGMLGAYIAPWFSVRIRKRLHKTDFWPHPHVDTVFVELKRRDKALLPQSKTAAYEAFLQGGFSTPKIFAKMPLAKAGVPLDLKPSQLSLEQWIGVFEVSKV